MVKCFFFNLVLFFQGQAILHMPGRPGALYIDQVVHDLTISSCVCHLNDETEVTTTQNHGASLNF